MPAVHTDRSTGTPPYAVACAAAASLAAGAASLISRPAVDGGRGALRPAAPGIAPQAIDALQRSYLHVLSDLPDAQPLREAVARAATPEALWALRATVFARLPGTEPTQRWRRQLLHRSLDSVFG